VEGDGGEGEGMAAIADEGRPLCLPQGGRDREGGGAPGASYRHGRGTEVVREAIMERLRGLADDPQEYMNFAEWVSAFVSGAFAYHRHSAEGQGLGRAEEPIIDGKKERAQERGTPVRRVKLKHASICTTDEAGGGSVALADIPTPRHSDDEVVNILLGFNSNGYSAENKAVEKDNNKPRTGGEAAKTAFEEVGQACSAGLLLYR
jgi:hypothetical protein